MAYCARPRCRALFDQPDGKGRRRVYCSDNCRRTAENELRQAQSRLAAVEHMAKMLRADIACFGLDDETTSESLS